MNIFLHQINFNNIYQISFIICALIFLIPKIIIQIKKIYQWVKWKKENNFVKKINKKYHNKKIRYINKKKHIDIPPNRWYNKHIK